MRALKLRLKHMGAAALSLGVLLGAAAAEAKEIFLYNWTNYIPRELLDRFTAETGITVTLDTYDSNETLLAKLKAGGTGYDVIVPSDYMVKIMIDEGVIQKIDVNQMENFKLVGKPHDTPWYDPERAYTAPYMWGTTGFTYDRAAVGMDLEDSWKEFFEPRPELAGKIASLNDQVEVIQNALRYLGLPRCNENPADMAKVQALLLAQKPSIAVYNSDGTIERMAAHEVVMHMQWNGAAHRTKADVPGAVFVYPREGLSYWTDNLAIPVGAKNVEEAKVFINWMMTPKAAAEASNFSGYNNGIPTSVEFMDQKLKDDPAVATPEEYLPRLDPNKACSAKSKELYDRVWTKVRQ
ncbi:extracellular solute-binding protein [Zavarzinia sp. CC-PAN008]|uniref:extracellular solute-binding protein n=1 Tax=Zavarzinia sp. CC-PAN008 TaxID=3243332 RepID=UPI003F74A1C5